MKTEIGAILVGLVTVGFGVATGCSPSVVDSNPSGGAASCGAHAGCSTHACTVGNCGTTTQGCGAPSCGIRDCGSCGVHSCGFESCSVHSCTVQGCTVHGCTVESCGTTVSACAVTECSTSRSAACSELLVLHHGHGHGLGLGLERRRLPPSDSRPPRRPSLRYDPPRGGFMKGSEIGLILLALVGTALALGPGCSGNVVDSPGGAGAGNGAGCAHAGCSVGCMVQSCASASCSAPSCSLDGCSSSHLQWRLLDDLPRLLQRLFDRLHGVLQRPQLQRQPVRDHELLGHELLVVFVDVVHERTASDRMTAIRTLTRCAAQPEPSVKRSS